MSHSQVISLEDYRRRREPRRHLADFSGHYEVYASAAAFVTAISLGTLLIMMRGPAQIAAATLKVRFREVIQGHPTQRLIDTLAEQKTSP
jgi:hypothetical protein